MMPETYCAAQGIFVKLINGQFGRDFPGGSSTYPPSKLRDTDRQRDRDRERGGKFNL